MGVIFVRFPVRRHARASSACFAASRAKRSADKPSDLARSVAKTRVHQSDGMVLRCHHFLTLDEPPQSISDAIPSREGQRSMTSLNEVSGESVPMPGLLGQYVPIGKGDMVRDTEKTVGHPVPMSKSWEKLSDSDWRAGFQLRLNRIQGHRSHEAMADLLDMPVESWKKCVNRGDSFPLRRLPKLASLAGISIESLIKGDRDDELPAPVERYRKRSTPMKAAARR